MKKDARHLEKLNERDTWFDSDTCPGCGLKDWYCYCDAQSGFEDPFTETLDIINAALALSQVFQEVSHQNAEKLMNEPLGEFDVQSGTTNDNNISMVTDNAQYQNLRFRDQNPSYLYDVKSDVDPTRMLQDSDDASLENFFSRPIKISEQEWSTSTTLGYDLDPWDNYFSNPRVINRITNYNLLRAKLHLKIVINGNGFQYGRAIAAYLPMDSYDSLSTLSSLVPEDLVQTSQLPHVYLDPTTSTGGEMELPFFWFENYVSIPESGFRNMGRLYVRSLNGLKHANGASDVVTVSVFAWATDVQFSVLTSRDSSALTAQSGTEVDEANRDGIVSGPATTVMKVSNALGLVPAIRPFAMATSATASTIANVARSLGYCRPPVTKNPEPYRPTVISQLATTNTPDTALKMTVDDKQELTIDPRIAGLGPEDPMSITEIAKRESYLTKFSWAIGAAPETLLWNARVSPVTWAQQGSPTSYHFPACCMAALPFKYWTGSMKFRFQIVCSSFHKGRLKFVYDPQYIDTNEYNTNFIEVVDIADTQDFTMTIGNGQTRTLLDHHLPGSDSATQLYSTTKYTAKEEGNGVLAVYIVNELTTPNSTVNNDIEINVFVSMGDDFEVFVPDDYFQKFVFKPQSGMESGLIPESQETQEPSAPQQAMSDQLGPAMQDNALINMVFTGESIMSFRQLLKRYNLWRREFIDVSGTGIRDYVTRKSHYPFLRGNVSGAVDSAAGPVPYNYCNTLLMHWVTAAFSGWRGSIRYKVMFPRPESLPAATRISSHLAVERDTEQPFGSLIYSRVVNDVAAPSSLSAGAAQVVESNRPSCRGVNGMVFTDVSINPTLEFESPYYSEFRFCPGKPEDYTDGNEFIRAPTIREHHRLSTLNQSYLDYHVAAGEDFQVYFFTGLPRMYFEITTPAAA